jgi:hypothetical protein
MGFALATGVLLATLVGCSTEPMLKGTTGNAATINDRVAERAAAAVSGATGLALQGDVASAIEILARVPEAAFAGDALVFRNCMFERFGATAPSSFSFADDAWITALGQAYVNYWRSVLTKATPIEAAEDRLAATVGQLIGRSMVTAAELEDAEPEILAAVQGHGLHALLGRTLPLRELMLWKKQSVLEREVDLPGGRETVNVFLLDDFVVRGWGHYATCGRRSAGGWTTDTALFAVSPAYKNLDDEVFSVRFLGHEAQHFSDKRRFPGLESWELEYRAKLVELSLATYSQPGTLKLFCENRAASNTAPHGYANARVVREIEERLGIDEATLCGDGEVPTRAIQELGRKLLEEDTAARQVSPGPDLHQPGHPG